MARPLAARLVDERLAACLRAVRSLGLAPSTFLASFMSAFASRRTTLPTAVLIAVGLTVLSVLVFVFALSLRLPLFPSWFGR